MQLNISDLIRFSAPEIVDKYGKFNIHPIPEMASFGVRSVPIDGNHYEKLHRISPKFHNRFVLEVPSALVLGGAFRILDWESQTLIHHPFLDWSHEDLDSWKVRFNMAIPERAEIVQGRTVLLDGTWSLPFFHFVSETLGKIYVLDKYRGFKTADKIFLNTRGKKYADWWCDALGIDVKPLPNHPILCDSLILPSYSQHCGFFSTDLIDFLNASVEKLNLESGEKENHKHIYIVRKGTRKVTNESNLLTSLRPYGFMPIVLEDYDVGDQAKIFRNAEIIIAPHGAGLTNLVFSLKKTTSVIELFSKSYINGCYAALSSQVGINYFYCVSENEDDSGNYIVDIGLLEKFIKSII